MTQGSNVDTSTRLRIATRIHFALLRRYGEAVEIDSLLKGDDESREALWVCEASGDAELGTLAGSGSQNLVIIAYASGSAHTILQQAVEAGDFQTFIGVDGDERVDAVFRAEFVAPAAFWGGSAQTCAADFSDFHG